MVGFVLYGSMVLLPVMLQTLFGYSSLAGREAMAPRGVGSLIMMPMVGMLTSSDRSAQAAGDRPDRSARSRCCGSERSTSNAEPVGLHAAAVPAGRGHGAAVRAADDGVDGDDQPAAHGIRDEPVQPDAQHRRRRRHCHDRHLPAAAPAGGGGVARRARQRLRPAHAIDARRRSRRG